MRGRSIFLFFVFLSFCSLLSAEESNPVFQLKISGTIDPAIARYVSRGLEEARKAQAAAVIIELDTPGGLDSSMRAIVQGIMNSAVPVIIYVAPSGARAASSGTFMTLASHVAAMAPGTSIGAAHPVQSSHEYSGPVKDPSVTEQKLTQDAVVYLRSLAEVRGRNVEWAELFVTENRLATDEEAYEKRTVDLIVSDVTDLFNQADGIRVNTVFGPTVLELKNRPRFVLRPSLIENLLHQLAHPNMAYILLLLGAYGLIFELATPGAVFPGVMGAIFLIMSLVALETLEVNWAGVALICLSFIFFLTDIRIPGHGFLTAGGIIIFLVGSAFLFPGMRISHLSLPWGTIGSAAAVTTIFFSGIIGAGIRALKKKMATGVEGLIGAVGMAKTDVKPDGMVQVNGEMWRAQSVRSIKKGDRVKVVKCRGLTLTVEPMREEF